MKNRSFSRIISLFFWIFVLLSTVSLWISASEVQPANSSCNHTPRDYVKRPATCTMKGLTQVRCAYCNLLLDTKETPALGHDWDSYRTTIMPTCTDTGEAERTCNRCKATSTKVLPTLAHQGETTTFADKFEDCWVVYYEKDTCKTCGEVLRLDKISEGYEHVQGDFVTDVEPTCTTSGSEISVCRTCGKVLKKRAIPPLEHKIETTTFADKFEDCRVVYYEKDTCKTCGEVLRLDKISEGYEHVQGGFVTDVEPTCTTSGSEISICRTCGIVLERQTIPALGHIEKVTEYTDVFELCFTIHSTITKCTRCNKLLHRTDQKNSDHGEFYKMILKPQTCTQPQVVGLYCGYCKTQIRKTVGESPTGHEPETTVLKRASCRESGLIIVTCTKCGECLESKAINKTVHTIKVPIEHEPATCGKDGYILGFCKSCNRLCKMPLPAKGEHVMDTSRIVEASAPGCSREGYKKGYCKRCDTLFTEYTPAFGHDLGSPYLDDEVITQKVSCYCDGIVSVYCRDCKKNFKTVYALKEEFRKKHANDSWVWHTDSNGVKTVYCDKCCGEHYENGFTPMQEIPLGKNELQDYIHPSLTLDEYLATTYYSNKWRDWNYANIYGVLDYDATFGGKLEFNGEEALIMEYEIQYNENALNWNYHACTVLENKKVDATTTISTGRPIIRQKLVLWKDIMEDESYFLIPIGAPQEIEVPVTIHSTAADGSVTITEKTIIITSDYYSNMEERVQDYKDFYDQHVVSNEEWPTVCYYGQSSSYAITSEMIYAAMAHDGTTCLFDSTDIAEDRPGENICGFVGADLLQWNNPADDPQTEPDIDPTGPLMTEICRAYNHIHCRI